MGRNRDFSLFNSVDSRRIFGGRENGTAFFVDVHDIFCGIFLDRLDGEIGGILRRVDQDFIIIWIELSVNSVGPSKYSQYGLCS
jgi:hypothetical protein